MKKNIWQSFNLDYQKSYFLSFLGTVILSWLRFLLSNSLKVDSIVIPGLAGHVIHLSFLSLLILHFYSFWKLIQSKNESPWKYVLWTNIIGIFMLPCISNDIFSVLNYAENFKFNTEIYSQTQFKSGLFIEYVSELYTKIPCVYGLGAMSITKIAITNSVINSYLLFKFIAFILSVTASYFVSRSEKFSNFEKWILCLNPIWTIHGIGHGHIEVFTISLLVISILFAKKNNYLVSAIFFGIAFTTKFSVLFCLPILAVLVFIAFQKNFIHSALRFSYYFLIIFAIVALEFLWTEQVNSIISPMKTVAKLWPTNTIAEMVFFAKNIILNQMDTTYTPELIALNTPFLSKLYLIQKISFIVFIFYFIWKYKKFLMDKLPFFCFALISGVLFIYSHRFMSWYLLLIFPFFTLEYEWKKYLKMILLIGFFSTLQDVAHFNHLSPISPALFVIGIPLAVSFQVILLWKILREEDY